MLRFLVYVATWTACLAKCLGSPMGLALSLPQQLELSVNQVQRIKTLASNGGNQSFVFDFGHPTAGVTNATHGQIVAANAGSFPALIGLEMAMNLFTLEACGVIVPHYHPRADEFVFVTEGSLETQFFTESGSQTISNTLNEHQATVFPQGAIHFEYNPSCKPAQFLGVFNFNDPGTMPAATGFFTLNGQVVEANLGEKVSGTDIDAIRHVLPPAPVAAIEQCLKSCGIN